MKDSTTIAMNLHRIAVEQDFQETLLDDEKCMHCDRELISKYSLKTHCCGACSRKGLNGRPTTNASAERKKAKAEKRGWDYDINKGHGERFFRAFDRAFNLQSITLEVKYDTKRKDISNIKQNNIIEARSRDTTEVVLGTVEGEPNKSPSNFQPHGVARSITADFESADRGSNPLGAIHTEPLGEVTYRHHNTTATSNPTNGSMSGEGLEVPSPPPIQTIDSGASPTHFFNDTKHSPLAPGTTIHRIIAVMQGAKLTQAARTRQLMFVRNPVLA